MKLWKSFLIAFMLGMLGLLLQEQAQPSAAQIQTASRAMWPLAVPPSSPAAQGPFIGKPVPAFSFDGDVSRLPQTRVPSQLREAPRPLRRQMPNAPMSAPSMTSDPVRQAQMGTRQSPTPLENFAGLSSDGWYPPDPNGDVGPNDYVQAVNVEVGIYSKAGTLRAIIYFDTLFSSANGGAGTGTPCDSISGNHGDPIALYDAIVDRWLIADFAWSNSNGPFYECIAYSKTGNPVSGGWNLYPMSTGTLFPDYPKFGVWSDGIYMSANMYGATSEAPRVWALNRNDMVNGASMHNLYFDLPSTYGTLLPGNLRGSTMPPAGEPAFFASIDEPNMFHLWKFYVNWNTLGATFSGPTNLTVVNFVMPCNAALIENCVPQPGVSSSYYLDSLGDRLMMQLQYRNIGGIESLWVNHTVASNSDGSGQTGIRWYEIRNPNGAPYIYQQGTYMPNDSTYRWMGSLAVDGFGNMALGYSLSSTSIYPSIAITGRLVTDTLGTLPQAETTLIAGTGSQSTNCGGSACNRWGDYSAMTIDPTDDCTFWYTNEYYASTGGNWQTRIGSFRLAIIPSPPPSPNGSYLYYFPFIARGEGNGSVHCY